jgi:hypothetical protein
MLTRFRIAWIAYIFLAVAGPLRAEEAGEQLVMGNPSGAVADREKAKPGHVVLVNGTRHRGATNRPLACSGRTHRIKFTSKPWARRSHRPQRVGPTRAKPAPNAIALGSVARPFPGGTRGLSE